MLDEINADLALAAADYRVLMVETIGLPEEAGVTVLWRDVGNQQLSADFVPGDPRRNVAGGGWSEDPNQITFAIDTGDGLTENGVSSAITTQEIRDAMATWDDLACSDPGLTEVPAGGDLGFVAALFGLGGSFNVVADLHHAGWREIDFGGATIAATFTLVWTSAGIPTDIDNNRRADVAFREIYYDKDCDACAGSPLFIWEVDDGANDPAGIDVDIESIALHETGHGLSQAHFGKGFFTPGNDPFLHQAPASVMGAAYVGPRTALGGSDNGGHCGNWANWPQN